MCLYEKLQNPSPRVLLLCCCLLGSSILRSYVPDAPQGRERGHSCQGVQVQLSGVWLKRLWFGIVVLCFPVEASTSKSRFPFARIRIFLPRRRALHPEVASPIHDSDDIRTLTLSILTGLGTSKASTSHPRDCAFRGLLAQQSAKNRSQLQLRPAGGKGLQNQGLMFRCLGLRSAVSNFNSFLKHVRLGGFTM